MFLNLLSAVLFLSILTDANPITPKRAWDVKEKLFKRERFSKRQTPADFFSTHASSPTLVWYPCYVGLQCARLEVPLDYAHPIPGDVFKLALVKIPAKTNVPYKGVFFVANGLSSSVDFISQEIDPVTHEPLGQIYQDFSVPGFDVIAWDVRGIGHTTPQVNCFANDADAQAYAVVERLGLQLGAFNGSHPPTAANILGNIQTVSTHQKIFGAGCKQYYGHYLPYIGSADSARDLNRILTLIGGNKLRTMNFYGYSTVLGTTYAAMYPNGFDRMLLDGVVNTPKLYLSGDNGPSSIIDAKKGEQVFFDSCSGAGACPASGYNGNCCPFWAATPALVQARYEKVKAKYYYKPFKSVPQNPTCLDCERDYYYIATGLADLLGLGSFWLDLFSMQLVEWENGYAPPGGAIEFFSHFTPDVTYSQWTAAIMSLDQGLAIQGTIAQAAYVTLMNTTSSQLGTIVANQELYTANWPVGPKLKNPYLGPVAGLTSGKMLFIGNTANPATPISNAKLVSLLFPGSGVVTINALGATTFFNGDSPCLDAYRNAFFNSGTMPPFAAFCNDIQDGLFGKPYVKDYR